MDCKALIVTFPVFKAELTAPPLTINSKHPHTVTRKVCSFARDCKTHPPGRKLPR